MEPSSVPRAEPSLLISCEHAGNRVPRAYRSLFADRQALLGSHRGFDRGALPVARHLARSLEAPLLFSSTTRLLVDPNRSSHHPAVFSEVTRPLPRDGRMRLLARYHRRHRDRVRAAVTANRGTTLHLAVHSFTPVWKGVPRRCTIGILYDPGRPLERGLAIAWQRRLREHLSSSQVRRNAPYRGNSDGLTTTLRREFGARRYLGLELELNQRAVASAPRQRALARLLESTLRESLAASR